MPISSKKSNGKRKRLENELSLLLLRDSYNQFHNILRLSMFYQIFLSPQVKRWTNITYKHGTYELPH